MNSLPEEIFVEIVLLLPVKSLLRSRLVSKSWRSCLSNPEFVKQHVARTTNNPNNDLLIFANIYYENELSVIDVNFLEKAKRLNLPIDDRSSHVVSSCNGLLCFADRAKELYLWNPVTRQVKNMLGYKYTVGLDDIVVFGFGFDRAASDYKAVRIVQKFDGVNQVEMYSLNMNCWKEITVESEIGLIYDSHGPVTTVNGSIYWLALKQRPDGLGFVVTSFNVQSLNFCVIQLPNDLHSDNGSKSDGEICKFKESVALCYRFDQGGLEIYTLVDGKCWIKELTIKSLDYLVGCLKTGELIGWKYRYDDQGICFKDAVLHDSVNDLVKYIPPIPFDGCGTMYHYTESLLDLI